MGVYVAVPYGEKFRNLAFVLFNKGVRNIVAFGCSVCQVIRGIIQRHLFLVQHFYGIALQCFNHCTISLYARLPCREMFIFSV